MSDLSDFLLARIAEDEAAASELHELACDLVQQGVVDPAFGWRCTCGRPARILMECGAKRQFVEEHGAWVRHSGESGVATVQVLTRALRYLALSNADHPDYRDDWRP